MRASRNTGAKSSHRLARALVVALLVACGAPARSVPSSEATRGNEITLYRDRAVIVQRIVVVVPDATIATVRYVLPAGVAVDDVAVLDAGPLTVSGPQAPPPITEEEIEEIDELDDEIDAPEEPPAVDATPTTLTFGVSAPRAGRYRMSIGYVTDRLAWSAAYTMTTTPARATVSLRGAVAIENQLDVALDKARVYVVDSELGAWRGRMGEHRASALVRAPKDPSASPVASPHDLGELALGTGETRVELVHGEPARPMRSVLVYDPIGTRLDNADPKPIFDPQLGTEAAPARVTESFEIPRARASSEGLPGGPVRLLERRSDGTLALLGESRLFDAAALVATADTISIGTAEGVTGTRTRREVTIDEDDQRIVEEFVLTIANTRSHPVEVVVREHLYRGQNWRLPYFTSPVTKEGPQQISLRLIVPPRGTSTALYVVVYTQPKH